MKQQKQNRQRPLTSVTYTPQMISKCQNKEDFDKFRGLKTDRHKIKTNPASVPVSRTNEQRDHQKCDRK